MDRDWARLGSELASARKHALDLTQTEIAKQLGVSRSAVQGIERGDAKRVSPTMRAYARAVGWADESIDAVLAGGNPTSAEPHGTETEPASDAAPTAGEAPSDLPLRVMHGLREGALLDATVIELPTNADVRMTVVVRGSPDASPEEIRRALEAWERAERHLQHLDEETNGA
ncbi:helix-turn-helix domain-containing protein [Streptomyces cacaoi]|uniref:helix-turn-helix domain-containing protein n=1 Tax=Streptomyces cacaoi TaxID=1898 RepID=UPI003747C070